MPVRVPPPAARLLVRQRISMSLILDEANIAVSDIFNSQRATALLDGESGALSCALVRQVESSFILTSRCDCEPCGERRLNRAHWESNCTTATTAVEFHQVRPTGRTASWRLQPISISHADVFACGTGYLANQLREASASTRSRPLFRRHAEQSEATGRAHEPERAYSATRDENSTAERPNASRASDTHAHMSSATQACGVRAPCAGDRPVQRKALGGRSPRQRLDTRHSQQHLNGGCDPPRSRCMCSANDDAHSEQSAAPDLPAGGSASTSCMSAIKAPGGSKHPRSTASRWARCSLRSQTGTRVSDRENRSFSTKAVFSRTGLVRHQQPGEEAAPF